MVDQSDWLPMMIATGFVAIGASEIAARLERKARIIGITPALARRRDSVIFARCDSPLMIEAQRSGPHGERESTSGGANRAVCDARSERAANVGRGRIRA